MKKIRKGDKIVVRIGKDKGKQGTVLKVLRGDRVLVENINVVKRHTRPNPGRNITGGILQKEAPIHVSNVMLFNGAAGKGERTGVKTLEDGRKVRVFKRSGEVADV